MREFGNFSLLLLAVLLSWAVVVFGIVLLLQYASLAGITVLFAMVFIAWSTNAGTKAR